MHVDDSLAQQALQVLDHAEHPLAPDEGAARAHLTPLGTRLALGILRRAHCASDRDGRWTSIHPTADK